MGLRLLSLVVVFAATLLLPATAARGAGGLPIGGEAGPGGVTVPGADSRYVTLFTGRDTVIQRVLRAGGRVAAWRSVGERLVVPTVATDGTPGGLSADGRRLVLFRPPTRFPFSRTHLAIVRTDTLAQERVTLKGGFTFDAISPDGRLLYLVQYLRPRDVTRYAVRAYDVERRRLLPGAVVDRREPDERMAGLPLTRETSPDGRWAYTLYDGAGHEPFIHALDTTGRRAFCIDLPALRGYSELFALRLQRVAGGLLVVDRGETVAFADTRTFRATDPPRATRAAQTAPGREDGDAAWPVLVGIGGLAVCAGVALLARRRRQRSLVRQ